MGIVKCERCEGRSGTVPFSLVCPHIAKRMEKGEMGEFYLIKMKTKHRASEGDTLNNMMAVSEKCFKTNRLSLDKEYNFNIEEDDYWYKKIKPKAVCQQCLNEYLFFCKLEE